MCLCRFSKIYPFRTCLWKCSCRCSCSVRQAGLQKQLEVEKQSTNYPKISFREAPQHQSGWLREKTKHDYKKQLSPHSMEMSTAARPNANNFNFYPQKSLFRLLPSRKSALQSGKRETDAHSANRVYSQYTCVNGDGREILWCVQTCKRWKARGLRAHTKEGVCVRKMPGTLELGQTFDASTTIRLFERNAFPTPTHLSIYPSHRSQSFCTWTAIFCEDQEQKMSRRSLSTFKALQLRQGESIQSKASCVFSFT